MMLPTEWDSYMLWTMSRSKPMSICLNSWKVVRGPEMQTPKGAVPQRPMQQTCCPMPVSLESKSFQNLHMKTAPFRFEIAPLVRDSQLVAFATEL
jgi:hypothetical protein